MLTNYGIIAILVILIVAFLAMILLVWYFISSSNKKPSEAKTGLGMKVNAQSVVQKFISHDLKKRSFIIRQNQGGFKIIFEHYSTKVISRDGEVAGWQTLPDKPVTDSLSSAVEIAQGWVHANE